MNLSLCQLSLLVSSFPCSTDNFFFLSNSFHIQLVTVHAKLVQEPRPLPHPHPNVTVIPNSNILSSNQSAPIVRKEGAGLLGQFSIWWPLSIANSNLLIFLFFFSFLLLTYFSVTESPNQLAQFTVNFFVSLIVPEPIRQLINPSQINSNTQSLQNSRLVDPFLRSSHSQVHLSHD